VNTQAEAVPEGVERIRAANAGPLTLTGTNTYVIGEPAFVVDPGPQDPAHLERVWAAIERHGGLAGIALTHRHFDHAGGVGFLRERSGAPLAAAPEPAGSGIFEEPGTSGLALDVALTEADRFGPFEVIETPGHSLDSISFLFDGVLFCGDTVLGEGSVFIAPGAGALARYLASLRRLEALELTALCPGHGPVVPDPRAKLREYIEHRLDRERRLLAALEGGRRRTRELLDEVWDDVPPPLRPAAALTLEAHLEKLDQEGRLPSGVERLSDGAG
jgi:glyoxylase-like metal-dependent hydrolase (beta-lactamase superfamily II)